MKYYYIIRKDRSVIEVPFTKEGYQKAISLWSKKGLIVIKDRESGAPYGIDSSRIGEILLEGPYDNWTRSAKPHEYIRDGIWYDGKGRQVIRHEKWKETLILEAKQKRLEARKEPQLSQEQREATTAKTREWLKDKGIIK